MKNKFKKYKEVELNVPYLLIQKFGRDGKYIRAIKVKILLLDGEKRVVFDNGSESISLYDIKGELVKRK